jgi:hypothetical protein
VTLKCTSCQAGIVPLIPDLEGRACRYNIAESDGVGGCEYPAEIIEEFDPVFGYKRNRCAPDTCNTGYEWDPVTWTCTLAPGLIFCVEEDDGDCDVCLTGF